MAAPTPPAEAQAQGGGETVTPTERSVIETLLELAYAAWGLADNTEDAGGDGLTVERSDFALLEKHLNTLDDLPDDQPGYTMGEAAKARWSLRRLLGDTAPPSAPVGVERFKPRAVAFVNSDGRPEWINPDWPEVPRDPHAPLYSQAEVLRALAHQPAAVDEAMARRLDDYPGGEFDIRIGKQAAHSALTAALAGQQQGGAE